VLKAREIIGHSSSYLVTFSLNTLVNMSYYRVRQAKYIFQILVTASQEYEYVVGSG